MNSEKKPFQDQNQPQPVAYDSEGRPLYAQPPQVVYYSRPHEPVEQDIPDSVKLKHDDSKRNYPELNLSAGEYVISAVRRHPIGLFTIWSVTIAMIVIVLLAIPAYLSSTDTISRIVGTGATSSASINAYGLFFILLSVLIAIGGYIATVVYNNNKFFLTNESVAQFIQVSLFSKKEQTISLANIEDASFRQHGFIQHLFNYGSIRLSTEGDETTYRFNYVSNPREQITKLNNAVEAFKNGRPFEQD